MASTVLCSGNTDKRHSFCLWGFSSREKQDTKIGVQKWHNTGGELGDMGPLGAAPYPDWGGDARGPDLLEKVILKLSLEGQDEC